MPLRRVSATPDVDRLNRPTYTHTDTTTATEERAYITLSCIHLLLINIPQRLTSFGASLICIALASLSHSNGLVIVVLVVSVLLISCSPYGVALFVAAFFLFRFSILFRVVGPSIANIAVVRPATETVVPRARVMVYEDANTRSISINHE